MTPEGIHLRLVHVTGTSRNRDGWHLIVTSPYGNLMHDWHFGREVDEAKLADALQAVNAVPVLRCSASPGGTCVHPTTRPEGTTQ